MLCFFAGNNPPSKQVNGFWYHSSEGHQLLKLAMGNEALSANCTVRTASGSYYLKFNRWGDSRHRYVPNTGRSLPRKATLDISRYNREEERKHRIRSSEVGPIRRCTSPVRNWRATGLRNSPRGRKLYNPQVEVISDEEGPNERGPSPYKGRKGRRSADREREARATFGHFSNSTRGRTPSPEAGYKRRSGNKGVSILHPLRRAETQPSLNMAWREKADSDDTDSIPDLTPALVPATIRMKGDTPRSPSPRKEKQQQGIEEWMQARKEKQLAEIAEWTKKKEVLQQKHRELDIQRAELRIPERMKELDEKHQALLDARQAELDQLLDKVEEGGDRIDKDLQKLPKDEDVDLIMRDRENVKKWLEDVAKARAQGENIPEKPDIGVADLYTAHLRGQEEPQPEEECQPEDCPQPEEGPTGDILPQDNREESNQSEEAPEAEKEEDSQGPQAPSDERPPVPIEAHVVVLNQPPPPQPTPKPLGEASLEDREEEDSDCQILEEAPEKRGPPEAPSTPASPRGLWRLKKRKGISVTLQMIPDVVPKEAPGNEVPPTPQPAPTMENPLKGVVGGEPPKRESCPQEGK